MLVDDEDSILSTLKGIFCDEGCQVQTAISGEEALSQFSHSKFDLVLLDIWLPGINGMDVLKEMITRDPFIAILMISGHGTIETAIEATKLGAYYFIEKPIDLEQMLIIARRALEQQSLTRENLALKHRAAPQFPMIGSGKAMRAIKSQIEMAAPTNSRVLICGENGTGKELVARAIHLKSHRADAPFVDVNCAAIPEELIESELFGHEKGAFTGGTTRKTGKFELAHQGTIFLDEVGDMSLKTQAKVLRVLEEQKIERVGGNETIFVDVRVIAASNKPLREEMSKGNFREDLFFRLNVIPIQLPPLRERREDIPQLCEFYLSYFCKQNGKKMKTLDSGAIALLQKYDWPGNIRELRNIIERLVIMVPETCITAKQLPYPYGEQELSGSAGADTLSRDFHTLDLKEAKELFEKKLIEQRLKNVDWNITKAAQSLGIDRSNLHKKIKIFDLKKE